MGEKSEIILKYPNFFINMKQTNNIFLKRFRKKTNNIFLKTIY
jgi:hypothetical protein